MELKLLKKGIKVNGKYYPAWYSGPENNINGHATIYLKTYDSLPADVYEHLDVQNDSDIQSDYIVKDRIRVAPGDLYFKDVCDLAARKQ